MLRPRVLLVAICSFAIALTACSSSTKSSSSSAATTIAPAAQAAQANDPVYAEPGPYKVGMTTIKLPDRQVWVWYPADDAAVAGKPKATYDQSTPLPASLKGLLPAKYNSVTTMDAYDGVKGSAKGPFPVVLFAHGYGAYPLVNSANEIGIAGWGFVVVSVDYFERGLANQVLQKQYPRDPTRDPRNALAGLDLVTTANTKTDSPLYGVVDDKKVGAVGHSAGGTTVFDLLKDPRVSVAVGYAPGPPTSTPADKPTMIIAGTLDNAFAPPILTKEYDSFPPPKRRVEVVNAGHNTFTDVCPVIRSGGGLVQYALQNKLISPALSKLALNGCDKKDLAPEKFLPIVQHFTVAELRDALAIDPPAAGLGDGIANAFPGVTIHYTHQP